MIKITTIDNKSIEQAISELISSKFSSKTTGFKMQKSLLVLIKQYVSKKYPGSKHWSANKIKNGSYSSNSATVDVEIPGASRAFHDIDINPKNSKHLAIPMHKSAYGIKARSIPGLFYARKKDGKEFLAKNDGGSITFMYFLANHVHQKQDRSLMPTDNSMAKSIISAIFEK